MKRTWIVAVTLVFVVIAAGVMTQGIRTHQKYGSWSLTAPETPARLDALSRQYDKEGQTESGVVPDTYVRNGSTDDGAAIFVPRGSDAEPQPVVILVQDGSERVWEYALVGGP